MVSCKGCGSKLVFDIASQQMKCSYCGQKYPVSAVSSRSKSAEEHPALDDPLSVDEGMEVTIYTCSQCGAEIIADQDIAVTWCSYCGSPATLSSRLGRIRRPDRVIPFKLTKEQCIEKYRELAKKQIYAPSSLTKYGTVDSFRGIYMPFWVYEFEREGSFAFQGKTVETLGNIETTTLFSIAGDLESRYTGLAHDASVSFDDTVSEKVVPFWMKESRPFDDCYLNGFYGDAADQGDQEYEKAMLKVERGLVAESIDGQYCFYGINSDSIDVYLADPTRTTVQTKSELAMFPVWFMSYRHGGRISYATVNGQTGRIYAEFPASPLKFLILSLLTAVPLFLLFNLFVTAMPSFVLFCAVVSSFFVSLFYEREIDAIHMRQYHVAYRKRKKRKDIRSKIISGIGSTFALILVFVIRDGVDFFLEVFENFSFLFGYIQWTMIEALFAGFCFVWFLIRLIRMQMRYSSLEDVRILPTNLLFVLVAIASMIAFFINPASDSIYYTIAVSVVAAVCFSVAGLIKGYNILSSVRPKQFQRSGGEDNA